MKRTCHTIPWLQAATAALPLLLVVASTRSADTRSGRPPEGGSDGFLLIDRSLVSRAATAVVLNDDTVIYQDATGQPQPISVQRCIALIRAGAVPARTPAGVALLADGQRLPGTLAVKPSSAELLRWVHPRLGQVDVRLDDVRALTFSPLQPVPESDQQADTIILDNGDRLMGLITGLGDPLVVEVDLEAAAQEVRIPVERVAAIALITSDKVGRGRRFWFSDGTVLDVGRFSIGDDGYVRLSPTWADLETSALSVPLQEIDAILFDQEAMLPLGMLAPSYVGTEAPRYVVPRPRRLDPGMPLELGRIEYRGPLVARYALPVGSVRFAADAELPEPARVWGDLELVLRDDDEEVYRRHLNGEQPRATINVPLRGSELTIELTQGRYGPIHDRLVLHRAMLLVK